MSYRYILHWEVQQDYEEALKWYAGRSLAAAEKFVAAVDHALQLICEHSTRWRNEYKHYYELGVKKYSYTIIYIIERHQQLVVVTSVYHHKRNSKRKYRKMK
jgi:plasmid stabilization system protein ParE